MRSRHVLEDRLAAQYSRVSIDNTEVTPPPRTDGAFSTQQSYWVLSVFFYPLELTMNAMYSNAIDVSATTGPSNISHLVTRAIKQMQTVYFEHPSGV